MPTFKNIIELARQLRRNQTKAEKQLWSELRNRKLDGAKFLRQHPIVYAVANHRLFFFIADFYCAEKSLVIELDGKIHDYQQDRDEQRDLILKAKGLNVLRIKNEELKDMVQVKARIRFLLTPWPPLYFRREGARG
jgi:very-short-patch-repair endonuclease